jgi:hypothetical protein
MHENKIDPLEVERVQQEIEKRLGDALTIPAQLRNPHSYIIAIKKTFDERRADFRNGLMSGYRNQIDIQVSADHAAKALRFMDTFIKTIHARGHTIGLGDKVTVMTVFGEEFQVRFRERTTKIETTNTNPYPSHRATGNLYFKLSTTIWAKEFTEDKRSLSEQLSYILAYLEVKGKLLREESIRRQIYWDEQRKQIEEREALKKREEQELKDFKTLLARANRWHEAQFLRKFIEAMQVAATGENKETREAWINWATKKADWYDPLINADDTLLANVDRDRLTLSAQSFH